MRNDQLPYAPETVEKEILFFCNDLSVESILSMILLLLIQTTTKSAR